MISPSPSFSSYFNTDLAEIADRVTAEFTPVDDDDDLLSNSGIRSEDRGDLESNCDEEDEDFDFEFNLSSLVPADGDILPVYPLFDRELLRDFDLVGELQSRRSDHEEESARVQVQLRTLFLEDRDGDPASSSSSEEDEELEQIPSGTYCVWTPRKAPLVSPSPERCTKSNSTGSSASGTEKVKAWKLSDLMKRSRSDGKDQGRLVVLTPKKKSSGSAAGRSPAREGNSGERRREAAEKNKRRSYLPYRQDLLGFSVSPQAIRKMHILPF